MLILVLWTLASLTVAVGFVLWRFRSKETVESGTACIVRGLSGALNATVVAAGEEWLLRFNSGSPAIGERVRIEITRSAGVSAYSGTVISCDTLTTVSGVSHLVSEDRRQFPRVALQAEAHLDGTEARMLDVSECGARLACDDPPKRGDRVMLHCPAVASEPVGAWVLESTGSKVRVRFEEILPLPSSAGA